jgi:hypothetical protein
LSTASSLGFVQESFLGSSNELAFSSRCFRALITRGYLMRGHGRWRSFLSKHCVWN